MRKPDPGPLGETFFDARVRAITAAFFVKSPLGGCVESVVTFADHRLPFLVAMSAPSFPLMLHPTATPFMDFRIRLAILKAGNLMPLTLGWREIALRLDLSFVAGALIGLNCTEHEHGRPLVYSGR